MPTATSGGASNAWDPAEQEAAEARDAQAAAQQEKDAAKEARKHPAIVGEHGPELVDGPQGWTEVDPAPAADAAHASRAPIVADPVLPESGAADYNAMTKAALVDEAGNRELPVSGSKAELAARLAEHDAAQAAPESG